MQVQANTAETDICNFTKQENLDVKFALISVAGTLIALPGIIGNLLVVIVNTSTRQLTANRCYIAGFSAADSVIAATAVFLFGGEHFAEYYDIASFYNAWASALRYCFPVIHIAQATSTLFMLVGTLERYLNSAYAQQYQGVFGTLASVKWSYAVILLTACGVCLPRFFELDIIRCAEGNNRLGSLVPVASSISQSELYQYIYSFWTVSIGLIVCPFVILAVLTTLILRYLQRTKTAMQALIAVSSDTGCLSDNHLPDLAAAKEVTKTFISLVILFMMCNLWAVVLTMMEAFFGSAWLRSPANRQFYSYSREVINFFAFLTPSMNFVVYVLFCKQFRSELVRRLRPCRPKPMVKDGVKRISLHE